MKVRVEDCTTWIPRSCIIPEIEIRNMSLRLKRRIEVIDILALNSGWVANKFIERMINEANSSEKKI